MSKPVVIRFLGDASDFQKAAQTVGSSTKKLDGVFDGTKGKARSLDDVFGGITGSTSAMGAAALGAGVAFGKFALDGIRKASDLNEQISASEVTFGKAAEGVKAFGRSAAGSLALSNRAALEAANQFGGLFKAAGFADTQAAGFSKTMVSLASDLASFKNVSVEDAVEKLRSGLSGESEPLKQLGIFINEAATSSEALRLGLAKTNKEITEGDKILSRYSLILKATKDAQGDMARTSESFANQQRRFAAETENLQASLGDLYLPMATEFTELGNHGLVALGKVTGGSDNAKDSLRSLMTLGVYPAVQGLNDLFSGSKNVADATLTYENAEVELQAAIKSGNTERAKAASSMVDTKEKLAATTKALLEQRKAWDDSTRSVLHSFSAELSYKDAVASTDGGMRSLAQAQSAATEATRRYGANSTQAKDAQIALDDAVRGLNGNILSQADGAVRLATETATAKGQTLSAKDETAIYRTELDKIRATLAPGSPLLAVIDGYIAKLLAIPNTIYTRFATSSGEAKMGRARAHGGPVSAQTMYLVGEQGPEMFVPATGGTIIPNNRLSGGRGGAMGVTLNVTINQAPGQDGQDVVDAISRWVRRNGPLPRAMTG